MKKHVLTAIAVLTLAGGPIAAQASVSTSDDTACAQLILVESANKFYSM